MPPVVTVVGWRDREGVVTSTMATTLLLHCPQMKDLAAGVAAAAGEVEVGHVAWRRFEDDFPDLWIEGVEGLRGRDVAFLACFDSPATILEQLAVIHAIPRYGAGSLTIVLPYFPTATMDRVAREGEIATAMSLARLFSVTPPSLHGPAWLVIFDIHALQERFYFSDSVIPRLESGIPLLVERLARLADAGRVAIAFPDEGAWKRFGSSLKAFPQVLCQKVRVGGRRVVTLREGEPAGRHVVIVDDMVKSGETLFECRRLLAERGASAVSAYATHGVFPRESWRRFLEAGFDHVWITDSCPGTAAAVAGHAPFEVLGLAGAIAACLP